MKYIISIKRQKDANSPSYSMSCEYSSEGKESIATMLEKLNRQLADPIGWQCSCMQKKCGSCAMVINGIPRLACSTFLKDLDKNIRLEPLSKFPVVRDLIVDRSFIFDQLKDMKVWLEENKQKKGSFDPLRFKASSCLLCGCCLEICPNFSIHSQHLGAIGMVSAYTVENNENDSQHCQQLNQAYIDKVYTTCGKSFSCVEVCPLGLPIEEIMAKKTME